MLLPFARTDLLWVDLSSLFEIDSDGLYSYPASVISVTLGQPSFLAYMGLLDPTTSTVTGNLLNVAGATSGVFQAGAAIGVIVTAIELDRLGRKNSVYINSIIGLFGGALIVGAQNISMFLAGRFFAGWSSFSFLVLTPVYTTELSPPKYRGFFVGLNAVFIGTGYSLAAWIGVGFSFSSDPVTQWRGPLGLYLVWPTLLIIIAFFSPESPRWLMLQDRVEEAKQVIFRLHSSTKRDDLFAAQEFDEIQRQTAIDKKLESSWVSHELFCFVSHLTCCSCLCSPRRRTVVVSLSPVSTASSDSQRPYWSSTITAQRSTPLLDSM